ncbi:MAG TPA: urease accessory protein UreD [Planctomycetota bacterium]|nr:urease accessory protein UreD [Planctomycetota bacterium]
MSGMTGSLRLVVGLDASGRCALRENYSTQLHRVLHLVPGGVPEEGVVYVLNPTGGVLQGDVLEADIRVEPGAHAIVTTPSSTKIHRMDRHHAESRTRLAVEKGAILEYVPEPVIPFGGSRFLEDLSIDVASGGKVLAWEILAPGRQARGEVFAYDYLGLRLRVSEGGRVVLRERADLKPKEEPFGSLGMGDLAHYGVLMVLGGDPDQVTGILRESLGEDRAGVSRLPGTGVLLKMLAFEGREIESAFRGVRERVLSILAGRPATPLRRM